MNRRLLTLLPASLTISLTLSGVAFSQQAIASTTRSAHVAEVEPHTSLPPEPVNAAACPGAELQPQASNLAAVRTATLCLVNQERALHGQSPLHPNRQLSNAAERHTEEMVQEGYFSHVGPSGDTPLSRISTTGYISNNRHISFMIGENIAWGTLEDSTPWAIVESWIASPPHLANILNGRFRDTAIGVVPAVPDIKQPGATYTQDFGLVEQ